MENHPIPQDVTGFKFKLIGSITLKEFGYLLAAGILATIVFILPIPLIARIPLIAIFSGIGAALAFLPIDGRPLDKMLVNFAKTIPSENQFVYRKIGVNIASLEYFKPLKPVVVQTAETAAQPQKDDAAEYKRNLFLAQLRREAAKSTDPEDIAIMNNVKAFYTTGAFPSNQPVQIPSPVTTPPTAPIEDIKPVRANHDSTPPPISPPPPIQTPPSQPEPVPPQPQQVTPPPPPSTPPQASSNVTVIAPASQLAAGFPTLPDIPNVLLGIIKDPRGKVLPNIIVEVVDAHGTPVRAFKTNALGQFAAATPLPDGNYNVSFEDPIKRHEFSGIEIQLNGTIFQPIEVISVDQRERLRQELFGK